MFEKWNHAQVWYLCAQSYCYGAVSPRMLSLVSYFVNAGCILRVRPSKAGLDPTNVVNSAFRGNGGEVGVSGDGCSELFKNGKMRKLRKYYAAIFDA